MVICGCFVQQSGLPDIWCMQMCREGSILYQMRYLGAVRINKKSKCSNNSYHYLTSLPLSTFSDGQVLICHAPVTLNEDEGSLNWFETVKLFLGDHLKTFKNKSVDIYN